MSPWPALLFAVEQDAGHGRLGWNGFAEWAADQAASPRASRAQRMRGSAVSGESPNSAATSAAQ